MRGGGGEVGAEGAGSRSFPKPAGFSGGSGMVPGSPVRPPPPGPGPCSGLPGCRSARAHTQGRKFPNELVTSSGLGKQKPLWVPASPATGADALIAANCPSVPFSFSRSSVYF